MANTFDFIGKISLPKESDKFKPIDKMSFSSGWEMLKVRFNCISDTNRVMMSVSGGHWKDEDENKVVKTFSRTTTDKDGNTIKGEKIEIPWEKRFDKDQIDKVAGFRTYVVDLGDIAMRYKLRDAVNKKSISDEIIEELGCDTLEKVSEALEKNEAKRKVFITEWDFAEYVEKLVQSDKYKDKLFRIRGVYDIQHNAKNGSFYRSYAVNKIELAPQDATPRTEMKFNLFFTDGAVDDDGTGRILLNGWTDYYDSTAHKNGFDEATIVVRETDEVKIALLKEDFECDEDKIKKIGLVLKVIDGAERKEITMDDLDERTRKQIEHNLKNFEDVKKALGGNTVGNVVRELRFVKYWAESELEDTSYTREDMHPAMPDEKVIDIFSDDDDDDDL